MSLRENLPWLGGRRLNPPGPGWGTSPSPAWESLEDILEKEKLLKGGLTIRGDSLYCPLALNLDSYGNCLADCYHCYFRNLNYVWGQDLKPLDLELFERKLVNGLNNKKPKTPLAWALAQKKTIRFGNKADPFQDADLEYHVSGSVLSILKRMSWSCIINTRFTENMKCYFSMIIEMKNFVTVVPVISPGFERDWEILERGRTTPPQQRLEDLCYLKKHGVSVGVNGEPFIPGYHTVDEFEDMLKRLKSLGLNRYNVYNFHYNAFVAKRLHSIGIDTEAIWEYNQDFLWSQILQKLLDLATKYNIILGCPDFVNANRLGYRQISNTCCGVDVPNPTTWNTHTWNRLKQEGIPMEEIIEKTWDGVGNYEQGKEVLMGTSKDFYTMRDTKKKGLLI